MSGTCTGGKRRSKKLRGGMGYGFGGTIGTAGPEWNSSWGGEITKGGEPVYDSADPQRGSSRRRKNKKNGRKTRRRGGGDDDEEKPKRVMPEPSAPPPDEEPPQQGGRRYRKSKKNTRKTRRRRGGQMEFCEDGSAPSSSTGLCADGTKPRTEAPNEYSQQGQMAGKYRRKSKKNGRKTRRRMRGGMSISHASAGFTGSGERGLANYQDVGSSQPFSNGVVPLPA